MRHIFAVLALLGLFAGLIFADAAAAQDTKPADENSVQKKVEDAILEGSDLPRDLLVLDYLQCFQGCSDGFRREVCEPLCLCVIRELQKRFAKASYLKLRLQMSLNNVDPQNRILMDRMAITCTKEIEDKGIVINPGKGDDADKPLPPPTPGDG